jgi:hypothetical protein
MLKTVKPVLLRGEDICPLRFVGHASRWEQSTLEEHRLEVVVLESHFWNAKIVVAAKLKGCAPGVLRETAIGPVNRLASTSRRKPCLSACIYFRTYVVQPCESPQMIIFLRRCYCDLASIDTHDVVILWQNYCGLLKLLSSCSRAFNSWEFNTR